LANQYSEYKAQFIELGLVYNNHNKNRQKIRRIKNKSNSKLKNKLTRRLNTTQFKNICTALEAYKAVHGNCLVPKKFVVPQNDTDFPTETSGMKLGNCLIHLYLFWQCLKLLIFMTEVTVFFISN
jgi:hypothetical protein